MKMALYCFFSDSFSDRRHIHSSHRPPCRRRRAPALGPPPRALHFSSSSSSLWPRRLQTTLRKIRRTPECPTSPRSTTGKPQGPRRAQRDDRRLTIARATTTATTTTTPHPLHSILVRYLYLLPPGPHPQPRRPVWGRLAPPLPPWCLQRDPCLRAP